LGTLGAEYLLAAGPGIGNLMIDGREQFAMDKVLLGVIIAGAVGATLNAIAALVERRALRWRVRDV
jgi:sulfonate transport system permease protein